MINLRASRREAARLAPRISIVYRAIDQLKPDPANPRLHSKKQIRQIANSIEAFGFNVPVLVDAELAGSQEPAMPTNYVAMAVDKDRDIKTEYPDAVGDLPDLLFAV